MLLINYYIFIIKKNTIVPPSGYSTGSAWPHAHLRPVQHLDSLHMGPGNLWELAGQSPLNSFPRAKMDRAQEHLANMVKCWAA